MLIRRPLSSPVVSVDTISLRLCATFREETSYHYCSDVMWSSSLAFFNPRHLIPTDSNGASGAIIVILFPTIISYDSCRERKALFRARTALFNWNTSSPSQVASILLFKKEIIYKRHLILPPKGRVRRPCYCCCCCHNLYRLLVRGDLS